MQDKFTIDGRTLADLKQSPIRALLHFQRIIDYAIELEREVETLERTNTRVNDHPINQGGLQKPMLASLSQAEGQRLR